MRTTLAVQMSLVELTILHWGSETQKRAYLPKLEQQVGVPVAIVGIGQRRDQIITLRDVLAITKLATVFEVYDTEQEAIAAFKGSRS